MSKPKQNRSHDRGEALLREWGIAEDAAALRAAFGRDSDADAAVLERLTRLAAPESVAALLEIENATADKVVRKEVRRALFRLEQRGLEVPKAAPAPTVATLGGSEIEGYISASDGNGDQLVWLVKPRRGELLHLFCVLNDPAGMREVEANAISRKTLRQAREDLMRRHAIRIVEVEWRYADQRMHQAHAWSVAAGTPVQGDYVGARNQMLQEPASDVRHPIFAVLDADTLRADPAAAGEAVELLQEPDVRTWFFPPEALHTYLEEIAAAQSSPVLLNEHQQRERVEQILSRAVGDIFGAASESWRRRLLDLAWVFHASQRPVAARRAAATALALERTPNGTGIPFCEALVRFSFAAHMRAAAERETERAKESLIVTPQEAARAVAQKRPPR